jgi:predicted dinucleotide-binding enzyme
MPPSMPPKIGIIGGGNVGQTLCKQLVNKGRPVVCGSRNPTSLQQQFTSQGLAAEVLSISDAVSQAEIVVLAIPGERMRSASWLSGYVSCPTCAA